MDALQSAFYTFFLALVTLSFLAAFLVPFWKARNYIRDHQADLWETRGPFTLSFMLNNPVIILEFTKLMSEIAQDEALAKADPQLARKARWCHELIKLLPRSFIGQIGAALVFFYFDILFTTLLFKIFF